MTTEPFARPTGHVAVLDDDGNVVALAPAPRPPLCLVLNEDGTVAAIGRVEFLPGPGQRVLEVPDEAGPAFVAADEAVPGDTLKVHYDERSGEFRGEGH